MKKNLLGFGAVAALALIYVGFTSGCASAPKNLNVEEQEFFDKTSSLMTDKEKKEFRALSTKEEREKFIEDFWKRRDPDPGTDVNEFKEEFFQRITQANRLFREGGKQSGWKTDRGRVYVLLGIPDRRDVYPAGYTFNTPPVEIWYYGFFKIIFIDKYKIGNYLLEPSSAFQLAQLNVAQLKLNRGDPMTAKDSNQFSVSLEIKKGKKDEMQFDLLVPLRTIRFHQDESTGVNSTVLKVHFEIWDESGEHRISEGENEYPIKLKSEELETLPDNVVLTIFQTLTGGKRYRVVAEVENSTDKAKTKREESFKL